MNNILITGTSKGLWKYLSGYYSEHNVYGCSRTACVGDKHFIVDITKEDEVVKMVREIDKIDVLINNAGVASMNHFLLDDLTHLNEKGHKMYYNIICPCVE